MLPDIDKFEPIRGTVAATKLASTFPGLSPKLLNQDGLSFQGRVNRHVNEKNDSGHASEELSTSEVCGQTAKQVRVHYKRVPPPGRAGQRIHLRRKLPPVPGGKHIPDTSPSPPVEID